MPSKVRKVYPPKARIGSWILSRTLVSAICIDCREPIPKQGWAWRSLVGSDTGRRVCGPCMERRQAWRKENAK